MPAWACVAEALHTASWRLGGQLAQGGSADRLEGRLHPRKPPPVGQVAPQQYIFDIHSVDAREAPDAQLSYSFEVHAKQPWQEPRVLAEEGREPLWGRAGTRAGRARSPVQLNMTSAQLIPSALAWGLEIPAQLLFSL